ncbi:MAG: nucleotide exchange factor GrpE [Thermodesulfobacteriota bacterium]
MREKKDKKKKAHEESEPEPVPLVDEITELPSEELRRLKEELEAKTKEARENHENFLRARADLENFRKRAAREKEEYRAYATESLVAELLPVIDNLERALEHAESSDDGKSLSEGVRLTVDQLFGVLKNFGLEGVKASGEAFDPELHHAISHDETRDVPPGTVIEEFQKGYLLKGRLIRPALVSVAKGPEQAAEGAEEPGEAGGSGDAGGQALH